MDDITTHAVNFLINRLALYRMYQERTHYSMQQSKDIPEDFRLQLPHGVF
jgi:hypothetical protein